MLKTRDFKGVEIFAVGIWNGNKFTAKDLNNIVASYQAEKGVFSIPIKLGHNDKQKLLEDEGMPAAGWIENVRVVGEKLVADFMRVPSTVADLIESGAFRKRSVEINKHFKIGDNVYPLVLTGLALLGANLPAVDTLADITKLYSSEQIEAQEDSEAYLFEAAEEEETFDSMLSSFDEFVTNRVAKHFKGKPGAPVLRSLHKAFREGLQRANKITHSKEFTMKPETLKLLGLEEGADDAAIEAAIEKLGKPAETPPATNPEEKAEFAKLQADFLKLQGEMAAGKATAAVDAAITEGKLLPVQKDVALKMALRDLGEFNAFIATQPQVVETGERGTQFAKDGNFSRFEPTDIEKQAAKMSGVTTDEAWRKGIMLSKGKDAGVEIPESFFASK